jgi:Icc protein
MRVSTPLRILHLSDTHLFGDDTLHYGTVDTTAALGRVLDAVEGAEVDLVVGSGDLSDDGSAASYERLRGAIEPWAARHDALVVYAMGNHDLRSGFAEVLGDGHGGIAPAGAPIDGVSTVGAWRIVTVDSSVPGRGYGDLDRTQLDRLSEILSTPADAGTVLVLHHPPIPAATTLLQGLELADPGALAEVVAGSDVRVILCGHYHHSLVGTLGEIPVIVTTGVANTADPLSPRGRERSVIGSGATIVTLDGDSVRSTVIRAYGPDDGEELFDLDPEAVARIIAAAGRGDAP